MSHNFIRSVVLPFLFWLISSVTLIVWLNAPLDILGFSYAIFVMSWLIAIWVITFSQWLYQERKWKNTAYIVANFTWSLFYFGVGMSLAAAAILASQQAAGLVFGISILLATVRLVVSMGQRIRQGRKPSYKNRYWRLVTGEGWFWRIWKRWSTTKTVTSSSIEETAAAIPSRRSNQSTSASPWRKITIPADAKPAEPIPIPPRKQVQSSWDEQSTFITSKPDIPSSATETPITGKVTSKKLIPFADHAKQLVARTGNKVSPVPFAQYWPTYDKMSPAQQRWYFYWRSELRMGNFLPTDLSYLFVYTYECINLVGFDSSQAAFERLVSFWQHYRALQPKLDQYLIDWIADFVVIHRLPTTALGWYAQVANLGISLRDPELYIESWLQAEDKWENFSSEVLFQLLELNKFDQFVPTPLLQQAFVTDYLDLNGAKESLCHMNYGSFVQ
ncbi:MAG TPA: TerB N-terminal domain-containing protein [Caldilineaceae bacterium]|nr:TerB N-terminal domain-containing protein [Caldilineaceae bacterium]